MSPSPITVPVLARLAAPRLAAMLAGAWRWCGWMALAYVFAPISAYVVWQAAGYGHADTTGDPATLWLGLACLGALTLIPALTIGRGRPGAFVLAAPLLLLAAAYQGVTAWDHFGRTMASKAERAGKADKTYGDAKRALTRLQTERAQIATTRSLAEIDADLWALQTAASHGAQPAGARAAKPAEPPTEALRAAMRERGEAERRDRLDAEIKAAAGAYAAAAPAAAGDAGGNMARLRGWLSRVTGLRLADQADLRALLLLLVVEVGAITAPAVVAMLRRERTPPSGSVAAVTQRADGVADGPARQVRPHALGGTVEPSASDVAAVTRWRGARISAAPDGARTPSGELYRDYCGWCARQRLEPLTQPRWGMVMRRLGHEPGKHGKGGVRSYEVRLRQDQTTVGALN